MARSDEKNQATCAACEYSAGSILTNWQKHSHNRPEDVRQLAVVLHSTCDEGRKYRSFARPDEPKERQKDEDDE